MRLPVRRQFARVDGVLASQKGKVTTGTRPIIGRIYAGGTGIGQALEASASATWRHKVRVRFGPVKRGVSVCARMIEWEAVRFVSHRR